MAQIDELIAVMMARRADALILGSDQPARLSFSGVGASGAMVPAPLLRAMLREIVPSEHSDSLRVAGAFEFLHAGNKGLMQVHVERRALDFHVVITPYTSPQKVTPTITQPPASTSFPIFSGSRIPASSFPAPLPRTNVSNARAKPTMNWVAVIFATMMFFPVLMFFINSFGFAVMWTLFIVPSIAILLDSYLIGVRPGLIDGVGDCGPGNWFFACVFFGFIGIPAYLVMRPIYKKALILNPPP